MELKSFVYDDTEFLVDSTYEEEFKKFNASDRYIIMAMLGDIIKKSRDKKTKQLHKNFNLILTREDDKGSDVTSNEYVEKNKFIKVEFVPFDEYIDDEEFYIFRIIPTNDTRENTFEGGVRIFINRRVVVRDGSYTICRKAHLLLRELLSTDMDKLREQVAIEEAQKLASETGANQQESAKILQEKMLEQEEESENGD